MHAYRILLPIETDDIGGGAYISNEVSVSICGELIFGGGLIFGGLRHQLKIYSWERMFWPFYLQVMGKA